MKGSTQGREACALCLLDRKALFGSYARFSPCNKIVVARNCVRKATFAECFHYKSLERGLAHRRGFEGVRGADGVLGVEHAMEVLLQAGEVGVVVDVGLGEGDVPGEVPEHGLLLVDGLGHPAVVVQVGLVWRRLHTGEGAQLQLKDY